MNCPFCNCKMNNFIDSCICRHENEMIFTSLKFVDTKQSNYSICKDGFEIYSRNNSYMIKYDSSPDRCNIYYFKGYIYDGGNIKDSLITLNCKIDVRPDNFDKVKNKLLKLIPFS